MLKPALLPRVMSSLFFRIVVGCLIIYSMVAVVIRLSPVGQTKGEWSQAADDSIQMTMAGFPGSHHPEEALPFADLVLLANITQIGKARWNTTDGLRPPTWRFDAASVSTWMIYTPFSFETIRILKGNASNELASQFAVIGGQVGNDRVEVGDTFDLYSDIVVGDQVILFLRIATDTMLNVAPYGYIDALRIDANMATADCHGSRHATDCQVAFELPFILTTIASAQKDIPIP